MNFKTGTIDFSITTQDSYNLHFLGLVNEDEMKICKLLPQERQSFEIDTLNSGFFGVYPPSYSDLYYLFKKGRYTIRDHYKSFIISPSSVSNFLEGELDSRTLDFIIIK